jgi:hypothetical protein
MKPRWEWPVMVFVVVGAASGQTPPVQTEKEKAEGIAVLWQLVEDDIRLGDYEHALFAMRAKGRELPRTLARHHFFYGTALVRVKGPELLQVIRSGQPVRRRESLMFDLNSALEALQIAQGLLGKDSLDKDLDVNSAFVSTLEATNKLASALRAEAELSRVQVPLLDLKEKDIESAVENAIETNPLLRDIVLNPLDAKKKSINDNEKIIQQSEKEIAKFYTTVKDFLRATNFVKDGVEHIKKENEVSKLNEKIADIDKRLQLFPKNPAAWVLLNPPQPTEPYPALDMLRYLVTAAERINAGKDTAKAIIDDAKKVPAKPLLDHQFLNFWAEMSTVQELFLRAQLRELQKHLKKADK